MKRNCIDKLLRPSKWLVVVWLSVASMPIVFGGCTSSSAISDTPDTFAQSGEGGLFEKSQSDAYLIKAGDRIDLSIWDYPEFTTSATVNAAGTIQIPLVGDVQAIAMTKDEFAASVKKRLAEYVKGEPRLTLTISSPSMQQKVSVIGAVTRQDNYPVASDVSLLEIVSTAGGGTTDSDLGHVRIIRAGASGEPIDVDLTSAMESGNVESIPRVHPGDTVYIPTKENFIRSFSDFLRDAVLLLGFFRVLY
ncbi:MAG TPA: polysaccharide biosynthesis/export family protein [Bacteroidota bacterium]|nr:polysaccharide biosynthesis/export family protein [Bacteroidota bacterium]